MGMAFFLFGDQNLIAPNMKNIGASLGITDPNEVDWKFGGIIPVLFLSLVDLFPSQWDTYLKLFPVNIC